MERKAKIEKEIWRIFTIYSNQAIEQLKENVRKNIDGEKKTTC